MRSGEGAGRARGAGLMGLAHAHAAHTLWRVFLGCWVVVPSLKSGTAALWKQEVFPCRATFRYFCALGLPRIFKKKYFSATDG
jgi:hypothetical protein